MLVGCVAGVGDRVYGSIDNFLHYYQFRNEITGVLTISELLLLMPILILSKAKLVHIVILHERMVTLLR